jgi:hypothetical protein
MERIFVIIFFVIISTGQKMFAQFSLQEISGKYQYIKHNLDSANLELKYDSTFIYSWNNKQYNGITTGTWIINKKRIVLNSSIKPQLKSKKLEDKFIIKATYDSLSNNKTKIKIKDVNEEPLRFIDCRALTKKRWIDTKSDSNGIVLFDVNPIKWFSVFVTYAQDGFISFSNKDKKNNFEIKVLTVNQRYLYFDNLSFMVCLNNNRLYLHEDFIDPKATDVFKKIE